VTNEGNRIQQHSARALTCRKNEKMNPHTGVMVMFEIDNIEITLPASI
jgi:hypothetical protein